MIKYTELAGVYHQGCRWPVVRVPLTYNNKSQQVEVFKVGDLPFPLLLGRDAPSFGDLIRAALPTVTALSQEMEEEPAGPSNASHDIDPEEEVRWESDAQF